MAAEGRAGRCIAGTARRRQPSRRGRSAMRPRVCSLLRCRSSSVCRTVPATVRRRCAPEIEGRACATGLPRAPARHLADHASALPIGQASRTAGRQPILRNRGRRSRGHRRRCAIARGVRDGIVACDGSRAGRCSRIWRPNRRPSTRRTAPGPVHRPHRRSGAARRCRVGPASRRMRRTPGRAPDGRRRRSRRRRPGGSCAPVPRPARDLARRPPCPASSNDCEPRVARTSASTATCGSSSPITSRPSRRTTSRGSAWMPRARSPTRSPRSMPHLAQPPDSGTLVLRADIHGGLIELGEGILSPSLAHVLERLAARRCVVLTSPRTRARAEEAAMVVRGVAGVPVDIEELPGRRAGQDPGRAGAAVPPARRPARWSGVIRSWPSVTIRCSRRRPSPRPCGFAGCPW